MKILVLNGSPKQKSDTFRLTEAFLKGLEQERRTRSQHRSHEREADRALPWVLWLLAKNGHCVIQDDQNAILDL